jgi:small subunit ribosomal protein S3
MGAEGIKVMISGRLEVLKWLVPRCIKREGHRYIHSRHIDYAIAEANTKVGLIGIKVRIFRGDVYGKIDCRQTLVQPNHCKA